MLTEALFLALIGAGLGALIVWVLFSGTSIGTGLGAGRVLTRLKLPVSLVFVGIGWAVAISLVGGMFPAVRAAREPIVTALREV